MGPIGAPGLWQRAWPFVLILAFAFAVGPIGAGTFSLRLWLAAVGISLALAAVAAWTPWQRLPLWTQSLVPLAFFLVMPVLREATGGFASGISVVLVPMLWIAVYGSRRLLAAGLLAILAVYLMPFGATPSGNGWLLLELRRALAAAGINGGMAWLVQRLVARLRQTQDLLSDVLVQRQHAAAELALAYGDLQSSTDELEEAYEREQQVVERLTELDRMKSRFVAMASHELRTPLTSITGFSSTMMNRWTDLSDQDKAQFVGVIEHQAQRLGHLVDDLLVLSRIQSGSIEPRTLDVPVRSAIDDALATLGLQNDVDVQCAAGLEVSADPSHVQQMLLNYITNARKYGRAPLRVQADLDADGASVTVRVRDEGDGVPADFQARLFEEFERMEQHDHTNIEGTGLGLSIVRGLAHAQGGEAWYEDNEPQGSTFAFRLNAALSAV
jgi:signal transduction histidine kinase